MHPDGFAKTKPRFAWKVAYALAATVILWLPLLISLGSKPRPEQVVRAIEPPGDWEETSVPFPIEQQVGDVRVFQALLYTPAPAILITRAEVRLSFLHGDKAVPHPIEGYIEVAGTPCRFEIRGPTHAADRRPVPFVRSESCGRAGVASGDLALYLRMGGPGRFEIYTRTLPEASRSAAGIYLKNEDGTLGRDWPALTGVFVDEAPETRLRRANLLSYVWTGRTSAVPVWIATTGALLLMWIGLCWYPFEAAPSEDHRRSRFAAHAGAGSAALALALACLYGMLTPPFQGADEPHHFASFATLAGRTPLIETGREWSKSAHTARIARDQFARFRPWDVGEPDKVPSVFGVHRTEERSSLTARVWQAVDRILPMLSVRPTFLALRLFNATTFATTVGVFAWLLSTHAPVAYPQLLIFPYLIVPALPFFAMHVGESALVTTFAVGFAAVVTLVIVNGAAFRGFGLLVGLFAAAFVIGARNSLPMLPMVAAVLLLRIIGLLRRREQSESAGLFWAGFAVGAAAYAVVLTEANRQGLLVVLANATSRVPSAGALLASALTPWSAAAVAVFGYLLERLLRRRLEWLSGVVARPLHVAAAIVPPVLIALIVVSFVGSLYWKYPIVESIQGEGRTTVQGYLIQVMQTAATNFRWSGHSMLMSESFWIGFGWLDTMPPGLTSTVVTLTALSLVCMLAHIAWRRDVRLFAILAVIAAAAIVTLVGYVYTSYAILTNIHGRYLIGWNLVMVAMCWTWPSTVGVHRAKRRWPPRTAWLLIAAGLIHVYAARFVLQRYF